MYGSTPPDRHGMRTVGKIATAWGRIYNLCFQMRNLTSLDAIVIGNMAPLSARYQRNKMRQDRGKLSPWNLRISTKVVLEQLNTWNYSEVGFQRDPQTFIQCRTKSWNKRIMRRHLGRHYNILHCLLWGSRAMSFQTKMTKIRPGRLGRPPLNYNQGRLATFLCKITVRRSKYCLEISKA